MRNKLPLSCWLQRAAVGLLMLGLFLPRLCLATPPPTITVQPLSQSVLFQGTVTFSVVANSGTTMTYQWVKNPVNITGATGSSYTIANVQTTDAGNYSVKVSNVGGSVTSANATLTVLVVPAITTQPQSKAVAQNDAVSFTVAASGSAPLHYQWSFNGAPVVGGISSTLTIPKVHSGNAGSYAVVVTNSVGTATSVVAVLTCNAPPYILSQPQNQMVGQGQNGSFSVASIGLAPVTYQWRRNGLAVAGATSSTLALTNIQANQAGSYTVALTNSYGSVTSAVATLTVNLPPGITTQPQSQIALGGQSATFLIVANGATPQSYQWSLNGTGLAGATNSTLALTNVQTTDAGSYTVVVTNYLGAATSVVASLTVAVPAAITTQPMSQTVTQGQNASFSVAASGTAPLSYQWSLNSMALAGSTNATLALMNVQSTDAGSYTVTVWNPWNSVTSAVAALTVAVPPIITTQPLSQIATQGQSATFSVAASGAVPLGYQWSMNGTTISGATDATLALTNVQSTDAGSYTVTVWNQWSSVMSAAAALAVFIPLTPPTLTAAAMTSEGFTFQLSAPVGCTCVILASTNLQDWTAIYSNVVVSGSVVFTDSTATNSSTRLYRAMLQ